MELFEFQDFLIGQIVSKTRLVIQEVGGLRGVIWLCLAEMHFYEKGGREDGKGDVRTGPGKLHDLCFILQI